MKALELNERTDAELRDLEKAFSTEKFTSRFQNFTNRLDDTSAIAKAKRNLARVKTAIRQRSLVGTPATTSLGSTPLESGEK